MNKFYAIAVDGPAGAGKTTAARKVAEKLRIYYLNTGLIYRALAFYAQKHNLNTENTKDVERVVNEAYVEVVYDAKTDPTILLNGKDVSDKLQFDGVAKATADISLSEHIREKVLLIQRDLAGKHKIVVDGRDVGTTVLPNAKYKFYLTASLDVRARRRLLEMMQNGETDVSYAKVLSIITKRDEVDLNRKNSPLRQASDAILIDTSFKTIDETAEIIVQKVKTTEGA